MNNEEAKFLLRAYRPNGQDAHDPQFQEALEQLHRDPELARWFAEERALDARLGAKLRAALQPPATLKANLLAQRIMVRPRAWWRQPAWIAAGLAACLVVLVTLGMLWPHAGDHPQFAQYRQEMATFVLVKLDRLDLMSRDLSEVRHWLGQQDAPRDFVVPPGLHDRPSLGCRLLDWQGQKVSLICFELANRQVAHLLVIERKALAKSAPESPQFARLGKVATVAWSRGDKTYLLASKGANEQDLGKLL